MALARLALALLAGCSLVTDSFVTNDFSGDPYPIEVQTENGAILVGLRAEGVDRVAILDVLSPITLIDPGLDEPPSVSSATLTLLGERPDTPGVLDLPRAQLPDKRIVSLHPCEDESCVVGPGSMLQPYTAIVGADALAGDALRLALADDQVFLLADVAGEDRDRTFACDAVFPAPYRGGGTLVIAGAEIAFSGRRVTLQACLGNDPDPDLPQGLRGADALLVLSTGIGVSILGESAYERYRLQQPDALPLDQLPAEVVYIASGPLQGRRATIDRMALVAASSGSPRAPCRQSYAHHLLLDADCRGGDCPCASGDTFCPVPASVELTPAGGIAVLVVPDAEPTLQALRTELRPDQPEVDGILGVEALEAAEVDIDYPHNRVLARCRNPSCVARPALSAVEDRTFVRNCIFGG